MKICLHTPLPRLSNELWEVLKLFYKTESFAVVATAPLSPEYVKKAQFTATVPTDDMQILAHEFSGEDGSMCCRFVFQGQTAERRTPVTDGESKLEKQRRMKRLCKLTLYELCKRLTGMHPAWGALTGIRPTRLFYEQLDKGLTHGQAEAALQKEMDVLPEKTALLSQIAKVQQVLPQAGADDWDVYIAMPFCPTRCSYCTFAGEAIGDGGKLRPYLNALYKELDAAAEIMRERGAKLRALYIGGGTPVSPDDETFAEFLKQACLRFPNPLEFTVEAGRPDAITADKLSAMRKAGVTRISVNPQTMNDATLRLIGRGHTAAQAETAFHLEREHGFDNINMDVIAGLPGETAEDFRRTMNAIALLAPDSLTVHTLALKRGGQLSETDLPPAETVSEMVRIGGETAVRMGMEPYYLYRQKYMAAPQQNVGYAKENKACLYNMDIMEETITILATGAGAISKRVFLSRNKRIERAPNAGNVDVYINTIDEMIRRKQRLFAGESE
ncbi:MAG: coproporphyrinogen dehydrogenase HemZ [Clostridiales bacterium]|nr:coproporphyrinogen dehydrogenase HemZ [Clostridiales bacterium]